MREKHLGYIESLSFIIHLNMAEIEIQALGKQCIDRRIGDVEKLKHEIAVWETERNQRQVNVNWQFTVDKARSMFQKSYDKLNN